MLYTWDEAKRVANLRKHGLDFLRERPRTRKAYVWIVDSRRQGEPRKQAFAHVFEVLAVLTVVFLPDGEYCPAS